MSMSTPPRPFRVVRPLRYSARTTCPWHAMKSRIQLCESVQPRHVHLNPLEWQRSQTDIKSCQMLCRESAIEDLFQKPFWAILDVDV